MPETNRIEYKRELTEGLEKEFGYFNIKEIEKLEGPFGLKVERDRLFEATTVVVDDKINEELN